MNQQQQPEPNHVVRLDAYKVAREVVADVARVSRDWRGWSELGDQARRAATSALLNLAEGAAQPLGSGSKRRHYEIARASAVELAAALDAADAVGLPAAAVLPAAHRLCALLGGLLRSARR